MLIIIDFFSIHVIANNYFVRHEALNSVIVTL